MNPSYQVQNPDFELSPFTGMTRKHYIECAQYLLTRAFTHVSSSDLPISFPIVPGKTYPQPDAPAWRYRSAEFEALERTFTLAGPLIHVDPETRIKGIHLRDYYCRNLYNALTPGHPNSLPLPVTEYRNRSIASFEGNDRNIAVLARFFNGVSLEME